MEVRRWWAKELFGPPSQGLNVVLMSDHEARVAALEAAVRYWSGYADVEFAIEQAKARGILRPEERRD